MPNLNIFSAALQRHTLTVGEGVVGSNPITPTN
jgi:hypothetical protein